MQVAPLLVMWLATIARGLAAARPVEHPEGPGERTPGALTPPAIDPGFCLAAPDFSTIDPRFFAVLPDPKTLDRGFSLSGGRAKYSPCLAPRR